MASPFLFGNKSLNLNDFLQLQALLDYEQQERDRHIAACQRKQDYYPPRHPNPSYAVPLFRQRAIDDVAARQSLAEKQRLEQAILKLKYLKDQYRRQRNAEIQSYLDAYRRQALIRAVQQEEEERYYRQCIAAALEQQRVNALWQQYLKAKQEEEYLRQKLEQEHILVAQQAEEEEKEEEDGESDEYFEEDEEDEGYSKYRTQQLEELLRHVFAHHPQYFEEDYNEKAPLHTSQTDSEDNHDLATDEIWKYLSDQKHDLESPRTALLSTGQKETSTPSDVKSKLVQGDGQEYEVEHESDESDAESERQDSSEATSSTSTPLPAVQDHVVSLQDLIQKLASEPVVVGQQAASEQLRDTQPSSFYSDEPKPSGIWINSQPPSENKKTKYHNEEKQEKDESYLPQHIFTEAEPTPTRETIPDVPFNMEEDSVIQVNKDEAKKTKEESDFVDSVAAEQKKQETNPQKAKQLESLNAIARELEDDSDLVKRWNQVLRSKLNFTKQPEGTLLVTASTDANRRYLGSEDEITRLMLKLDAVDSMGDEQIREKRRTLVKKCEHMVDVLDRMKHLQWQNAFKKLEKKKKNNRRRKSKKNKYKK
ncbi:hypothetical protein A0J61_07324 [Choanephora cucurbitarum]|uniref:BAG domain-containing protein n=1 Tax=Choanephora cucurbitarum TaxID=101091 RepID=A0A1C7NBB6_9FUNG|nr:hypothetical protein A0J61_07324 [Choanephora cucurbitarum]